MTDVNNQHQYWDRVANKKTFTHPLDEGILADYFNSGFRVLDYGCGYGRLTNALYLKGFTAVTGVDTSAALIARGKKLFPALSLTHIENVQALNSFDAEYDAVLLFAVLTCIPSNAGQLELITTLSNRLKKGGLLYISDYYLQENTDEVKAYTFLDNDPNNYGVFSLPEGASFRHHTKEWIKALLEPFEWVVEKTLTVTTMNGHRAEAFQVLLRKQ